MLRSLDLLHCGLLPPGGLLLALRRVENIVDEVLRGREERDPVAGTTGVLLRWLPAGERRPALLRLGGEGLCCTDRRG